MFKKICLIATICVMMCPAFGQVKLGFFIDPSISWLKSDVQDVNRKKARMGLNYGLMADVFFSNNYAFATGISLFNVGGTLKYDNGITLRAKDDDGIVAPGGEVKYKINYLKVPVSLKLLTNQIGRYTYYANVGIDPMVKVSAKANYADKTNVKINKEIKSFNLGYHISVGLQYPIAAETSLMFGLTYMNMFADMTTPSHDKISVNNLLLNIGILF